MSTRENNDSERSVLSRFGDALDSLMFGRYARAYTWFVRSVVVAFVLLALASLFTSPSSAVGALTRIVFALFVLTALLQVIALARRLQHGQEAIAESAQALEETADEVAGAADQVASLSETAERNSNESAGTAERSAGEVKEQAEHAKSTADAVKEQMDGTRNDSEGN